MLIEFSVSNFRAIKDKLTLSLVAGPYDEYRESNVIPANRKLDLLASAAIYGANASGKSSILDAMDAMRDVILDKRQRGDRIGVTPHLLCAESSMSPSEFEVVFIAEDGVQYQYGFSADSHRIYDEWLFAYPKGRAQRWIERAWDEHKQRPDVLFGGNVFGSKSVWSEATRENGLVLSTAVGLNAEQFNPVFDWFKDMVRILGPHDDFPHYTASLFEEGSKKKSLLSMLKAADFNIQDVKVEEEKFDVSKLPDDMPDFVKEKLKVDLKDKSLMSLKTQHEKVDGSHVFFDLNDESDGTQKFFGLLGPWVDILENGRTVFVDELHGSLHPLLVKRLVEMFHTPELNKKGAQLIFTTHDTAILNQKTFRRDQIWFTQRKQDKSTRLYPLSDFSPRKDHENIRDNYLDGRYGAIPFFTDVEVAMGKKNGNG